MISVLKRPMADSARALSYELPVLYLDGATLAAGKQSVNRIDGCGVQRF